MKKHLYRTLSVLLIIVLLVSSIASSFAVGPTVEYVAGTFFDFIAGELVSEGVSLAKDYIKDHIGYSAGKQCESSSDGYHHCESAGFAAGKLGTDEDGRYSLLKCTYCGEMFKYYSSFSSGHGGGFGKSDLQQSYEAQVEELPATGYQSDGSLLWFPKISYIRLCRDDTVPSWRCFYSCSHYSGSDDKELLLSPAFDCENMAFSVRPKSGSNTFSFDQLYLSFSDIYPMDGYYTLISSPALSISYVHTSGSSSQTSSYECSYSAGTDSVLYYAGISYSALRTLTFSLPSRTNYLSAKYYPLAYKVVPFNPSDTLNTIYNITSRPTSITGDYGIIGDNGQIIKVEGDKIVNETNNTYYNPATGETTTITDWSYNYEDRSYTVTTESGDTVTITYGDENVTIKEGDTTYNVYYLVSGSGSEDPGPDVPPACNHQWTETSTTPAICTVPGSRTLTCSLCNETKTEIIPAPGHKWTIKQEVKNEYDENGNQTQEGYTIWECSVCGEQQKTTDGTAPPGGGSGTGSGSSGGVFSGIFGLLVDFLGFFWNTFRDFVGEGVKGFLNALMDGTSSIFGLLNPFNWGG